GNIVESKKSTFSLLWQFLAFFLYFFRTLFGPLIGEAGDRLSRRRHGWNGNDRWRGSGGPGRPPRGKSCDHTKYIEHLNCIML
ncbi:hypothetical protein WUBG_09712, partial [Wuchereria bancrofti]